MSHARRLFLISLFLFAAALRVPASAQDTPPPKPLAARLAALKERIEKRRVELHIPGLSLAIVQGDQIVFAEGFGLRDLDQKLPVTPDTLFAIGSATKAFTAALAAMLVQDGVLDLDEHVTTYLPSFRLHDESAQKNATIRDLLCHRTGLGRTDLVWLNGRASTQQILDAVATAEPESPFRAAFHYNNVMVLAAGLAEAAAAKQPWDELLRARILDPLAMTRTCLSIEAMKKDANASLGYAWNEDKQDWRHLPMRSIASVPPAGCINSSANEMARWVTLMLDGGKFGEKELIRTARLEDLWVAQVDVAGGVKYGLGWMLQKWCGHRVVEHGGNIDGFAAEVGLLPDDKIGFVLLTNVSATPLQQESLATIWEAMLPEVVPAEKGALTPKELAAYEGKYHFDLQASDFTALVKDERLCLEVPGQTVYALKWPDDEGKWVFQLTDTIAVRFEKHGDAGVHGLTMFQNGFEFFLPKVGAEQPRDPHALPAEQLGEFCGRYFFEPAKQDWTVFAKDGRLKLDVPKQLAYTLKWPDADGRWGVAESAAMTLFFRRGDDGQVSEIEWHQAGRELSLKRTAAADTAQLPELADLMQRRAEVGGGAKFAALGTLRMTGTVRLAQQGLSGTATVLLAGTDRACSTLDFGVFGSIREGLDRDVVWSQLGGSPIEEEHGAKVREAIRQGNAAMYADLRQLFEMVEVLRVETLGGEDVAVVKATPKEGSGTTQYVSLKTGLPIKEETAKTVEDVGSVPTTTRYEDWREIQGVWIPFRATVVSELLGSQEVVIEKVETDVQVPDDAFSPGAAGK